MSDLSGRIAALAARGARFCRAGELLIMWGVCLLGIGFMLDHGAAVGRPVAGTAPALSGGASHFAWRLAALIFMKCFASACLLLGVLVHTIGVRRGGQAAAHAQRLARLGEPVPPVAAPVAPSFGRRPRAA